MFRNRSIRGYRLHRHLGVRQCWWSQGSEFGRAYLVADVGLPGRMDGRHLADAARESRPNLNVLFITGFAENALHNYGQLEPGISVLTSRLRWTPSPRGFAS
jgi:hypothetical protein